MQRRLPVRVFCCLTLILFIIMVIYYYLFIIRLFTIIMDPSVPAVPRCLTAINLLIDALC